MIELWDSLSAELQTAIGTLFFAALAVITGKTRNPLDNLLLGWFYRKWQARGNVGQ